MFMIMMHDCDMTCNISPFNYIISVNVQVCASHDAAHDVWGVVSWASYEGGKFFQGILLALNITN